MARRLAVLLVLASIAIFVCAEEAANASTPNVATAPTVNPSAVDAVKKGHKAPHHDKKDYDKKEHEKKDKYEKKEDKYEKKEEHKYEKDSKYESKYDDKKDYDKYSKDSKYEKYDDKKDYDKYSKDSKYDKYDSKYDDKKDYDKYSKDSKYDKYDSKYDDKDYDKYSKDSKYEKYDKYGDYDKYSKYSKDSKYDNTKYSKYDKYDSKYDGYKGDKYDSKYDKYDSKYDSHYKGDKYDKYSSHDDYDRHYKGDSYKHYKGYKGDSDYDRYKSYDRHYKGDSYDRYHKGDSYDNYKGDGYEGYSGDYDKYNTYEYKEESSGYGYGGGYGHMFPWHMLWELDVAPVPDNTKRTADNGARNGQTWTPDTPVQWNVYCPHLHEIGAPVGTLKLHYVQPKKSTVTIKGLKNLPVIHDIDNIEWNANTDNLANCTSAKKLKFLTKESFRTTGIPVAVFNSKLEVTPDGDDLDVKTASINGGDYKGGKHRGGDYYSGDSYSGGGDYYSGGGNYYGGPHTACANIALSYGPVKVEFTHKSEVISYEGKWSLVIDSETIPIPSGTGEESPCDQRRPIFELKKLILKLHKEDDSE